MRTTLAFSGEVLSWRATTTRWRIVAGLGAAATFIASVAHAQQMMRWKTPSGGIYVGSNPPPGSELVSGSTGGGATPDVSGPDGIANVVRGLPPREALRNFGMAVKSKLAMCRGVYKIGGAGNPKCARESTEAVERGFAALGEVSQLPSARDVLATWYSAIAGVEGEVLETAATYSARQAASDGKLNDVLGRLQAELSTLPTGAETPNSAE